MSLNEAKDTARAKRLAKRAELSDFGKPASQRDASPYPSKWVPKLRYAKDTYGISSAFMGHNRREVRAAEAVARNKYRDPSTGVISLGQRSKARRAAKRDFRYRLTLGRKGAVGRASAN